MATKTDFTIIKGKATDFSITIKQNGTTTPLLLTATDTFTYSLIDKKTSAKYATDVPMTVLQPYSNGEVKGTVTSIVSAALPIKKSAAEDGFIPRPNLRLVINGNTVNQGAMTATIDNVYVVIG